MASKKDLLPYIRAAREQGWTVEQTRNGHLAFRPPRPGVTVYAPSTPSDRRSALNVRAKLRRQGLAC